MFHDIEHFGERRNQKMTRMFNPPHPGGMLAEELECLGISAREFARGIGVAPSSVTRILNEKGPITPEMAVRIAKALKGPDARMWLRMQADYDLWQAEHRIDTSAIKSYKAPHQATAKHASRKTNS